MNWLLENLPSIGILALVIALVAGLAYSLLKPKKNGSSPCSGCQGCAMAGKCHGSCASKTEEQELTPSANSN